MDFGTYNAIVYNGNSVNDKAGIPAQSTRSPSWTVLQIALVQKSVSWFVRSQVAKSKSALWDVTNTIVKSVQASWLVRSWAIASVQVSWLIRMIAIRSQVTSWQVLRKTLHVLHLFWDKSPPKGPPSLRAGLSAHNTHSGLTKIPKVTAGLASTRTKPAIIRSGTFATITDEIN